MNNMPELKIGVVAVSRDCFPESLSVSRREALMKAYKEKYGEEHIYECPICIVESEIHMVQALEDIKKAGCNALVVYLGNFGPEISETLLAKHFDGPKMFVAAAEENGLEIVADEAYTADSNTDFSVQLKKIKDSGAELLFLPNYYADNALILQQAHDAGMDDVKKFGVDGMDGILGVENFDTSLAEGVMLLTPFSATSEDEKTQAFIKAYEDANKDEVPNQFAADTYDVLYAMKAAADAAEITPDMSNEDISAAMSEAMLSVELDGLTGKAKWTEDGECDKEPKAFEIQDGAYVEME
mgnify:CR=1 FL=1